MIMEIDDIKMLLENVKNGTIQIDDALNKLKTLPFEDIGFAKIDHHRSLRNGYPEVIFSQGKTVEQIKEISLRILQKGNNVLATRAGREVYEGVFDIAPDAKYFDVARIIYIDRKEVVKNLGEIAVVSAGTSDIPVAEEAAVTSELLGNNVIRLYDVGVAGIHRLLANTSVLMRANVIIVVAGMEGALASVVGGLVDRPVVAVPTSIGYGASFGGLAPLLTMLNSCASGVGVVNIDNGFGAGYLASMINKQR
jgi:pyridinium-3,5-biscarboxylic acid mononucleotide synthase